MGVYRQQTVAAYKSINLLHKAIGEVCRNLKDGLIKADESELADVAFVLRRSCELLDDSRKQLDKLQPIVGNLGMLAVTTSGKLSIDGRYCRARAQVKQACAIPSHSADPEEYRELCEAIGVAYDPATRLHWPTVTDRISELTAAGKELPPIVQKYRKYDEAKLIAVAKDSCPLDTDAALTPGIID